MAGMPNLSDILSQFSPVQLSPPRQSAGPEEKEPEFADRYARIRSDSHGATFERLLPRLPRSEPAVKPDVLHLEEEQPSRQTSLTSSFAGSISFNLSIRREVSAFRIRRVEPPDPNPAPGSPASATARSELREAGAIRRSSSEIKRFQADLSYSRTREIALNLDPEQGDRLNETGRRVSRTFQLSISLDVSFLRQFTSQSDQISSLDGGLFNDYLNSTDRALAHSEQDTQDFFNRVGEILNEMESTVIGLLDGFFQQMAEQFGLSENEASPLEEAIVAEVSSFFDDVGSFLEEARQTFAGAEPAGAVEPATAGEPEDVTAPALAA